MVESRSTKDCKQTVAPCGDDFGFEHVRNRRMETMYSESWETSGSSCDEHPSGQCCDENAKKKLWVEMDALMMELAIKEWTT